MTSLDFYNAFGWPDVGFEREYMTLYVVPSWVHSYIPTVPKKIYCNKEIELPLEIAFYNIVAANLQDEVKTWDGCFNIRPIRGYRKIWEKLIDRSEYEEAAKKTSVHSWGCAIDINAAWNRYGAEPTMSKPLVACFTDAGFEWGGRWSKPDGMHFQIKKLTTV